MSRTNLKLWKAAQVNKGDVYPNQPNYKQVLQMSNAQQPIVLLKHAFQDDRFRFLHGVTSSELCGPAWKM